MTQWYNFLDRKFGTDQRNYRQIFKKIVMDQVFFAPLILVIFFSYNTLVIDYYHDIKAQINMLFNKDRKLENDHQNQSLIPKIYNSILENLNTSFFSSYKIDCIVWPFFNFITFTKIPLAFRPIFTASVQLCWQIFLSYVVYSEENNKLMMK